LNWACAATGFGCGTATATVIEGNEVSDSRDMVAWYSNDNIFRRNVGTRSRYSIHFMFARDNIVEYNRFYDNAVGVYFMYTEGGILRHNLISHATGATGMAIGFKEASNTVIEGNESHLLRSWHRLRPVTFSA
jgi:nitrous oxidase accessory protein